MAPKASPTHHPWQGESAERLPAGDATSPAAGVSAIETETRLPIQSQLVAVPRPTGPRGHAACEQRAAARQDRYAARQAYERASATADRLAWRVRDLAELLDRPAE